jgi:hypothetical protein
MRPSQSEKCAEKPAEHGLGPARGGDDERKGNEGTDAHHIDDVDAKRLWRGRAASLRGRRKM